MENFEPLWWHWALVGFSFILAELALPIFVMIWFGVAGFLVMLALLLVPELAFSTQLLLWVIASTLFTFLWFRVFRRNHKTALVGRSSAELVGEIGMIAERVAPFRPGKVRFQKPLVGSDLWECTSEEEIESGVRVRVESIEGNAVIVKRLEG